MTATGLKMIDVLQPNGVDDVLTNEVLVFLFALHQEFDLKRHYLLEKRVQKQRWYDQGNSPVFPLETEWIRTGEWVASVIPDDLMDRRVEITGPVDRKMVINGLNAGARVFMADFEDANSPTWENVIQGQRNLLAANQGVIDFETNGKQYVLNKEHAVLKVRPRGLHLDETHILFEGKEASASLVDFGLYFYRNWKVLLEKGTAPYFYLPKLETYEEAAWWSEVITYTELYFGLPIGTCKVTVLIETISASFQLDEIIYSLKDHIVGLNCGRWDYIFSYIKKLRHHNGFVVPDRDQITMTSPFMQAYATRVIQVCHKRNIHAIGGMAAQIPVKGDEQANQLAFSKVREDKVREVKAGHDGTWVAHPALVSLAKEVFDSLMPTSNQIHLTKSVRTITEADLLELPIGTFTEAGLRKNLRIGVLYLESWLNGAGAVALYNMMEDAATAEISRAQVWLWLNKKVVLENGVQVTKELIQAWMDEEMEEVAVYVGKDRMENGRFEEAKKLFLDFVLAEELDDFLTLEAYKMLIKPVSNLVG